MTTIRVDTYPEESLRTLYINLDDKEDWDNVCELCTLPTMLHADANGRRIHGACTRRTDLTENDSTKEWDIYRKRMKAVRSWCTDEMKRKNLEDTVKSLANDVQQVVKVLTKGTTNKLIKPAKVPSWSKGMQLRPFIKSIEVWMENNKDMPENSKYNEIIESLKMHKEIEGLSLYIGEHVVGKLDTVEKQTVKGLIELLNTKYGRTRLEELEEIMEEYIKFNFNEYENEEEHLLAQEKLIAKQEEKGVTLKEWNTIWLMYGATQRQGTSDYHLQELRKVVKAQGLEVQKDFVKKYRELKIESHRGKQGPCAKTLYMGTPSKSRQRYQDQRIRSDSKGRDFYQDRKSRNDSRGRPYYRRYYRNNNDRKRDFSRDMRSISRNRSKS